MTQKNTNNEIQLPPKLKKFIKSKHKDTVDKMLDNDLPIIRIKNYLDKEGFPISHTYLTKYKKYRSALNVEEQNLDKFMQTSTISKVVIENSLTNDKGLSPGDKLKNDLEFLDWVIQTGADTLKTKLDNQDLEIEMSDVFEAIKIKNTITDGALAGMTTYGIENLTNMTENKYMALIKHMFRYISKEDQQTVLKELDMVEEDFYKGTDYYADYLKAQGYTDKQIKDKLKDEESD